ncbi:MAG: hypothetical protein IT392_10425 [Nitrospirae bacterium]|nr:hypothetical protein [Nitrospirota bacterium]
MKRMIKYLGLMSLILCFSSAAMAADKGKSPIPGMTKSELIKLAKSAAPASIADHATVMIPGADGKLVEAVKGTNGFACIPDIDGQEVPDPFCGDAASMEWADALMSGADRPTNTVPGIAYMAKGGWHFEKDGKILMKEVPGSKRVKEPPHWMLFWPVDSKTSGIPSLPNKLGTYVMWDGTPFAHLMIYQDPGKLK